MSSSGTASTAGAAPVTASTGAPSADGSTVAASPGAAVATPTSRYPLRSFSAIVLATCASAACAEAYSFDCVRPSLPHRPYRTVTTAPSAPVSQNFDAVPSTNSQRRTEPPPFTPRTTRSTAGFVQWGNPRTSH